MLMATNLSFGDASSLLHQLETELAGDKHLGSSHPASPHIQMSSTQEQRPRNSASYSLPSMTSGTSQLRHSQPNMSMFGNHLPILPPLNSSVTGNVDTQPPDSNPLPHERSGGSWDHPNRASSHGAANVIHAQRNPPSLSPRRRTPSMIGRSGSSGSSRVEGKGRVTKTLRAERPNTEDRSWFDTGGDGGRSEEPEDPSPRPKVSLPEIKRKEVPYSSQPCSTSKRTQETPSAFGLQDQVADILSTFDNSPNVPSLFSHSASDLQAPLQDIHLLTLLNSSTAPSLPATIYSLAVSNPSFFQTLRQAVPPEYCAISFFKRVEAQVYAICRRHSDYLFSGAASFDFTGRGGQQSACGGTLAEDEEMCLPDAKWCEAALRRRVNTIRRHLKLRKPLGKGAREQAMRALVRILWEVTDKGGYEERDGVGHATASVLNETSKTRRGVTVQVQNVGVYGRLIGKAGVMMSGSRNSACHPYGSAHMSFAWTPLAVSPGFEGNDNGLFAIDALWELMDCAGPSLTQLQGVLTRIKLYDAREGYIDELERFLMEAGKRQSSMEAEVHVTEGQEGAASRRSSIDSIKRARELSEAEVAREKNRASSKRRVS